jgi:hypothetical protein
MASAMILTTGGLCSRRSRFVTEFYCSDWGHGNMDENAGASGITVDSKGQQGPNAAPPCPPVVTNAQHLVVPATLSLQLSPGQLMTLNIAQLQYARDVSAAATAAYDKLILAFSPPNGGISNDGNKTLAT